MANEIHLVATVLHELSLLESSAKQAEVDSRIDIVPAPRSQKSDEFTQEP